MIKKYSFITVDSTNNEAKRLIRQGEEGNFFVIADEQTSGRGQFERNFFSPAGTGLYCSIALKLNGSLSGSFITQATAVAVCKSIENLHHVELGIKPINDLFYMGKKVGGILVETMKTYLSREYFAVFGIGINLYAPQNGFPSELKDVAGHLFDRHIDKGELVFDIISKIMQLSKDFSTPDLVSEYEKRVSAYEKISA